ncbi:MAG: general secretion pathway protein GspK [Chromatiales bacterium]
MALVLVLWVVALLTVLAASHLVDARATMGLAGNQVAAAQARALAEAGIYRAVTALDAGRGRLLWPTPETGVEWTLGDGIVRVRVENESGKLDLNSSSVTYMQRLLEGVGLGRDEASGLIGAILDFRDPDDLRRPNGAEADEYAQAGLPFGPKNAPFVAVQELQQVAGMTTALYDRIEPYLTVYSRPPHILDAQAASSSLVELLGLLRPPSSRMAGGPLGFAATTLPAQRIAGVYSVLAEARMGGMTQGMRAVVAVATSTAQPYRVLNWQEGTVHSLGAAGR